MDLEMPTSKGRFDDEVKVAVEKGQLKEAFINQSVERLIELSEKTNHAIRNAEVPKNLKKINHELAKKAATEAGILLKNKGNLLPFSKEEDICIIGELARTPRYQGTGSSMVTPDRVTNILDSFKKHNKDIEFAPGYLIKDEVDEDKLAKALELVKAYVASSRAFPSRKRVVPQITLKLF